MKALKILKDILVNMDSVDDDGYHFGKYATQEAIAELEALQHHKNNCDTCKWDEYCGTEENCLSSKYIHDRYEPKGK
jgi:hypothetical protein